jgi:iron complex transport system ATP-binding protein
MTDKNDLAVMEGNQGKNLSPQLLCLEDATVYRGDTPVLKSVNLEILEGQHAAILGPNGSGKSSLIKLIARDYYPLVRENGKPALTIYGEENWNIFELRSLLGIVSADVYTHFLGWLGSTTGLEVAVSAFFGSLGLMHTQHVTKEMWEHARKALASMDALYLENRAIECMSSGEARRVLIARALTLNPRALLLDEPTTGLDILSAKRFMDTLRSLLHMGKTLLLVTHHVEEILPEVERVVLLKDGRIFFDGLKAEALQSYRLSALYGADVKVLKNRDYYHAEVHNE